MSISEFIFIGWVFCASASSSTLVFWPELTVVEYRVFACVDGWTSDGWGGLWSIRGFLSELEAGVMQLTLALV